MKVFMMLDTIYNIHLQLALANDHFIALLHPCNGIIYELIHNSFRAFLLVNNGGGFSPRRKLARDYIHFDNSGHSGIKG